MGRRFHESESEQETVVDMSPLIDCVFILLIFFIVTTTFVDEKGVAVQTPQAAPPTSLPDQEPTTVVFEVTDKGDVLHEGRVVGLSGVRPIVKNALLAKDAPVIVQAGDAHAGLMLRVVDEARLAGADEVSIANLPG